MKTRLLLICLVVAAPLWAETDGGIKLSAAVDLVARQGIGDNAGVRDRLDVREAEVMLYAPIDHLFDGTLSMAVHREPDESFFEVHEAYIGTTKLIPRSRIRLGQFFLGVGRLNQFHRHDWPFISAPRVQQDFFAGAGTEAEGLLDTGLEYSYLLPVPFFLELTAGLCSGWTLGHAHGLGEKALMPTHYLRAATFVPWTSGGAQIGINYLGNTSSTGRKTTLLGLDFVAKWKEETRTKFLVQSEVWYRIQNAGEPVKQLGFYVFPDFHVGSGIYTGLRFDLFTTTNKTTASGLNQGNLDTNVVPTIAWKPSEFSTFRLAFNFRRTYDELDGTENRKYFEGQALFILGSHPAHDF